MGNLINQGWGHLCRRGAHRGNGVRAGVADESGGLRKDGGRKAAVVYSWLRPSSKITLRHGMPTRLALPYVSSPSACDTMESTLPITI